MVGMDSVHEPHQVQTAEEARVLTTGESSEPRSERVLIVDRYLLFGDLLRFSLEAHGMSVLPIATTAEEALLSVARDAPVLVVLEMALPDESGLSLGRRILQRRPETTVVVLSDASDPRAVREAVAIGFRGYLTKGTPLRQVVSAIRAVLDGQVVIQHDLARAAATASSVEEREADRITEQLTLREREILALLVQGFSSREIAQRLYLSLHTVRSHAQSVLAKLQVHSRLEAVAFVVRHGILESLQNDIAREQEGNLIADNGPAAGRAGNSLPLTSSG